MDEQSQEQEQENVSGIVERRMELGEFTVNNTGDRDNPELRFTDEKNVSNGILRRKGLELEPGATYTFFAIKKQDAPAPATITAVIPADDAGSLPGSAVIQKEK